MYMHLLNMVRKLQSEVLSPGEACEERDRSYLIVDPARDVTCTVLARTLRLDGDPAFTAFREERHRAPPDISGAPVSEELARWRAAAEDALPPPAAPSALAPPAQPKRLTARTNDLTADLWVEEALTDKGTDYVTWELLFMITYKIKFAELNNPLKIRVGRVESRLQRLFVVDFC